MSMVRLENIKRSYGKEPRIAEILKGIDLQIEAGEMIAIQGKSGSGKTTLLNILGGIDFPSSGRYFFRDAEIRLRNQDEAAKFRRKHIGVVVQHFALLDDLTAFENISVALWADRISASEEKKRVYSIMEEIGIVDLAKHYPTTLSGGEKQRVAIARALISKPELILADEPTGALDEATGEKVVSLLQRLHEKGHTILIVTHDNAVANSCSRIVKIRDGVFEE